MHQQFAHGLLGVFFALGHHAHKIALHHHRVDAGNMRDGLCFHAVQGVANEAATVGTGIRRAHHPTMQHAGHAHVVHINQIGEHLGRDVHARQALPHPLVLVWCFERRIALQVHFDDLVFQQLSPWQGGLLGVKQAPLFELHLGISHTPTLSGLVNQPKPGLGRCCTQWRSMHLDGCTGDGCALVGRHIGQAHHHLHLIRVGAQLLGHQLRQGGAQTGAQIDMTVQGRDAAVVPQRQHTLCALTGMAVDKRRLARCWGLCRQWWAHDPQNTVGFK